MLARFIQADTVVPGACTERSRSAGPQAWDRYAYVNDNPVRYTDPSGHDYYEPGCDCTIHTGEDDKAKSVYAPGPFCEPFCGYPGPPKGIKLHSRKKTASFPKQPRRYKNETESIISWTAGNPIMDIGRFDAIEISNGDGLIFYTPTGAGITLGDTLQVETEMDFEGVPSLTSDTALTTGASDDSPEVGFGGFVETRPTGNITIGIYKFEALRNGKTIITNKHGAYLNTNSYYWKLAIAAGFYGGTIIRAQALSQNAVR